MPQPALFSLPAEGSLLVSSDAGVWVVRENGSRRLLGDYREASWSPFGRFVVAAGENELAALEPDGDVRWTLRGPTSAPRAGPARRRTRASRTWTAPGCASSRGTAPATGCSFGLPGTIAWQPGDEFRLALASARESARARRGHRAPGLAPRARRRAPTDPCGPTTDGACSSARHARWWSTRRAARCRTSSDRRGPGQHGGTRPEWPEPRLRADQVWVVPRIRPDASAARRLFAGAGTFEQLTWAPDGSWVVVAWPAADQWVFLRPDGNGSAPWPTCPSSSAPQTSRASKAGAARPEPNDVGSACARPGDPVPDVQVWAARARSTAAAPAGARRGLRAAQLLSLGLVADLNERAAAPAGQGRRPRRGRCATARDLPRLAVVASRVGGDPRRRRPAALRLERRGRAWVRGRVRAARDEGRAGAREVPDRERRDRPRRLDARG